MVEDVAGVGLELAQVLLEIPVAAALADDRDVGVAHAHRLAGIDRDHHVGAAVTAIAFDLDLRRLVAARHQRLPGFFALLQHYSSQAPHTPALSRLSPPP